jgi:hypothetical protein
MFKKCSRFQKSVHGFLGKNKKQKIKEKTNTRKGRIFKTKILSQLIKWKEKEQISKHKKYDIELYVVSIVVLVGSVERETHLGPYKVLQLEPNSLTPKRRPCLVLYIEVCGVLFLFLEVINVYITS